MQLNNFNNDNFNEELKRAWEIGKGLGLFLGLFFLSFFGANLVAHFTLIQWCGVWVLIACVVCLLELTKER